MKLTRQTARLAIEPGKRYMPLRSGATLCETATAPHAGHREFPVFLILQEQQKRIRGLPRLFGDHLQEGWDIKMVEGRAVRTRLERALGTHPDTIIQPHKRRPFVALKPCIDRLDRRRLFPLLATQWILLLQ